MRIFDHIFKKQSYDLDTIEGIESIEIPVYRPNNGIQSPVDNIEYILQRKATEHKKNGRMELAIACLRKANEIFPYSNFLWPKKDYMRLLEFLKEDGRFEEAKAEEVKINNLFKPASNSPSEFDMVLRDARLIRTDLLISSSIVRTCGECAKYSRRIFSLLGKDKRFPVLPAYLRLALPEHEYCFNSFYPFTLGVSIPDWRYSGSLINWCNRPFTDERTRQQKEDYKNWVVENEQEIVDRRNYDFLREYLPEIAPKSFGGYRRMKNQRSPNYLKLLDAASQKGANLDATPDLSIYHF